MNQELINNDEKIVINLYGGLEKYSPEKKRKNNILTAAQVETVGEIIEFYHIPPGEARIVLLNGKHVDMKREVSGGEVISIFPLLGGG